MSPRRLFALEARDPSWLEDKALALLARHRVAWCVADSARYVRADRVTAHFVYLRLHGPRNLPRSLYPVATLRRWARHIEGWLERDLSVYVYFNNDADGHAVRNAIELRGLLGSGATSADPAFEAIHRGW